MKFVRTSDFGAMELVRNNVPHTGVDYSMSENSMLYSVGEGIVKKIVDYGDVNAGKTLILQLENGQEAVYGHLNEWLVKEGQKVHMGDPVALSGNTGHSTGAHLHFGIKENGSFVDPEQYEPIIQSWSESPWQQLLDQGKVNQYKEGADQISGMLPNFAEEMAQAFIDKMGEAAHYLGIWLLNVAPDTLLTVGMIGVLGAIASIPQSGKWASGFICASVVFEIIRRSVMGA
jgi:hypothetical protein